MWWLLPRRWSYYGRQYVEELGGAYVKVIINDDGNGKIADDSPLKYNDIKRIVFGSGSEEIDLKFPIFCIVHSLLLPLVNWSSDEAIFEAFFMSDAPKHKISFVTVDICEDDTVQSWFSFYTLTPAT